MRRIVQQITFVAALFLLAALTTPAAAQRILYVDDDGPADFDTIEAAIDAAADGDTVLIASGTYTGDGNRDIDFKGKAITVKSQDGPRACVIDCEGSEAEPHRGFYFHSGEDANSILADVSIVNGYADYGGGIWCRDASPRIVGCVISGNRAARAGGGLFVLRSHAQIGNCILSENETDDDGGGICCEGGEAIDIQNCTIINNGAGGRGGGIVFGGGLGNVSVRNTILWGNQASTGTQLARVDCGFVVDCMKATVTYCCIEPGQNSAVQTPGSLSMNGVFETNHNITDDPLLALGANGDCHLKSQAGRWDPDSASWILDAVTSPCIDAGDPDSPIGGEPLPNAGIINIGAYGGTAEASKSYPRSSTILHVDANATIDGGGSSWTDAYRYLQDALAAARHCETPVEIRVAQGCYKPDHGTGITRGDRGAIFRLGGDMTLRGGYGGVSRPDPNARDVDLYETVLSGDLKGDDAPVSQPLNLPVDPTRADNSRTLVLMEGNRLASCVLDGLRIDSASASAAVEIGLVYPYVKNCTFTHNASGAVSLTASGACPEFVDCQFFGNTAPNGSAIYIGGDLPDQTPTTLTVKGCIFRENHATEEGGAIVLRAYDTSYIQHCVFVGNAARFGGAVFLEAQETVQIANCIFAGNRATETGAGIHLESRDVNVRCCTFAENRARYGRAAVGLHGGHSISFVNAILRDGGFELRGVGRMRSPSAHVRIIYSNVETPWFEFDGGGNIDVDPDFVDPGYWDANETSDDPNDDFFVEGDYHLKSQAGRWDPNSGSWVADDVTSPCIDAGDPNSPVGDEPAPNGGIINMGAYGGTAEASMSPPRGPTEGQWTEPIPLDEINTAWAEEWSPTLSPNGLILHFGRVHSPTSHYGRIFQARRHYTWERFALIEEVPGPLNDSPGHVLCQWVSPDQLRMYYMLQVGAEFSLKVSERSGAWKPWPAGVDIVELNQYGHRVAAPYLTADERIIFFSASDIEGTLGGYDIWMATRPDQDARFGKPVGVEPINTTFNEIHSFVTADGLTMYFASDRNGSYQLFRTMRADLDSPFASPVHMRLFDTPDGDSRFPCLSADGTEFYFQRETNQDRSTRDIWVSYRID